MRLYHGTNRVVEVLLPPSEISSLREVGRSSNLSVVFATPNLELATRYSQVAAKKYGGKAVVLVVEGDFKSWKNKPDCSNYVARNATVVDILVNRNYED